VPVDRTAAQIKRAQSLSQIDRNIEQQIETYSGETKDLALFVIKLKERKKVK
jgi:hypothetical protein